PPKARVSLPARPAERPIRNPRKPVDYRIGGRSMPVKHSRLPSYRLHKPSGLAVVSIGGRDLYLGEFNSPESRAEYDRLMAEWLATGRRPIVAESDSWAYLSVNELLVVYLEHADAYYVKNGKPTTEPVNIRLALRPLRQLYGHTPAREFGPLRLKTVR